MSDSTLQLPAEFKRSDIAPLDAFRRGWDAWKQLPRNTTDECSERLDEIDVIAAHARKLSVPEFSIDEAEEKLRIERELGGLIDPQQGKPLRISYTKWSRQTRLAFRHMKMVPDETFEALLRRARYELVRRCTRMMILKAYQHDHAPVQIPKGQYSVIVLDPPWQVEKVALAKDWGERALDYPTMNEDQLTAMELPAADDCHVWCWTTHKFLPMTFRLFQAWGVKYICTFVWHKPGGMQPFGLPSFNCEFALYGRIGKPTFADTKAFKTCFDGKRGEHSEKPIEFYDMVAQGDRWASHGHVQPAQDRGFLGVGQ